MDEGNDMQDTAQLLIFIHGVSASFEVSEELAALKSLKCTTIGEDIFVQVYNTMEDWIYTLTIHKMAIITTDGTPTMVGTTRGLVGHLNIEFEERGLTPPTKSPLSDSQATTMLQSFEVVICHEDGCALCQLHLKTWAETQTVTGLSIQA